ncbi:secretin N-terminal domain-containing protein [Algisphaera agarilytica]|uniref:General secretion pathway protein D n=1 Tax=Algisphaera agarilytica TaxID=1385975 RepID=A0A7X0LKG8_9BACT|nr:secretin N-terminal domain-containing protein [Algisphaera agarilytica]MBB6429902.1 general secretion pathway protein D [Algisphaera agarilytica]
MPHHLLSTLYVWSARSVRAVLVIGAYLLCLSLMNPAAVAQDAVEAVEVVEAEAVEQAEPVAEDGGEVENAVAEPGDEAEGDSEEAEEEEPKPKTVSVSFRDTELSQIAGFYGRELDKPVLVDQSVANNRLTIMSNKEIPLNEAFELIGNALRQRGVIVVEGPRQIELLPIAQIRRINRPVVPAEQSVTELDDQSTIVDKIFRIEHYDVTRLKDLVVPMLPEYAFLVADPNLDRLVVTAAAGDLIHIERLVASLDVPRANDTIEKIFTVKNGDASEIATMVRTILAGTLGDESLAVFTTPSPQGNNNRNRGGRNRGGGNRSNNDAGSNTLFVERNEAPIMLQADLSRNWIIAAAPPAVMDQIEKWIIELDKPKERNEPYQLFDIEHADVDELAGQINEAINAMPDADIRASVRVIPFVKSRQILVYGSQRGRSLVRSLLDQLDIESSQFQLIKEIAIKHDSAENVKAKIEELFNNEQSSGSRYTYYFGNSRPQQKDLTVTADTQRNTVTIMTDPVRMRRIEEIIKEQWDLPVDLDDVKPKVYDLQYSDPVQVQELLEEMFTKSSSTSSFSWFSGTRTTETSNPVGRLFGEFSFNAMQDSNKLIVSTKNPANYVVIDELLKEIDQPQDAGVPIIIELKHANAEDVAEQLNAMFSEPGTPAAITRTERGLSDSIRQTSTASDRGNNGNNNQNNNNQNRNNQGGGENDPSQMNFWWSQSRPNINEQPTSNLIGKPRIVPVNRRNAIMVMAPRAHVAPLRDLVAELDKPGSQVVIHAIITEVQHDDESTLGVRFASDPGIFNDSRLADQAFGGGINADYSQGIFSGDGILNADVNLNFLIQLLVNNLNLSVINEPRLMTADNQEAHFFDGQDVPVVVSDLTGSGNDGDITRTFDYEAVGTRLHARPHITQDGEIDLRVNLELSRIVNGTTVFGNFIFDRRTTTTHVTLKDGQTIVISGIIEQEDFAEVRKFPLFGDIPLVGGLFRSTDTGVRNREVIAFITPHIVKDGRAADEKTQSNREWLERVRGAMAVPKDVNNKEQEDDRFTTPEQRGIASDAAIEAAEEAEAAEAAEESE